MIIHLRNAISRTNPSSFFQTLARISFAVTVFLIPFRMRIVLASRPIESIYRDYTDFLLFASDIFLVLTLLFWLLSLGLYKRQINFGSRILSIPLAALTIIAMLTSLFSFDPALSLYHSIRLVLLGCFYLYIVNEIDSLNWVTVPIAFQAVVQAIVGIAQILEQHSLGLTALQELELDPAWSGVSIVWATGIRSLRAYGLSDHPNILGGCFALALLFIASRYIRGKAEHRGLIVGIFTLVALALLLTFSRAAWIALAGGSIYMTVMLWRSHQRRAIVDLALLAGTALLILLPFLWHNASYLGVRINLSDTANSTSIEDRSIAERNALAEAANRIFADRPLAGVGIGALPQAIKIFFPKFEFFYQPAHVALLDAAAETGIFGALAYFFLLVAPWIAMWLNRARLNFSVEFIGVSAALLAVTLIGFFDYYTWLLTPGRLWQWMIWGLWATTFNNSLRSQA